jgi:hypothetical protein
MGSLLSNGIQPSHVGRRLLGRWPIIFFVGVVGGLVGLAAASAIPASYQASSSLGIGVDPNLALPYSPNVQYEADLRTQDLFLSDVTLKAARHQLPPGPAGASLDDFRSHLRLDHFEGVWYLRATAGTPTVAAERANAWASAATTEFKDAQAHAVKAGEFQALLFSVACKPKVVVAQGGSNLWACDEMTLDVSPNQVSAELLNEARMSHGILPGLSINNRQQAAPPDAPTRQNRALFALGGTLVGLVLGLLVALSSRTWLGEAIKGRGSQ